MNNKQAKKEVKLWQFNFFSLAGAEGLEPSTKVLETHVLPLHHTPKHLLSLTQIDTFVIGFAKLSVLILPGEQLAHDVEKLSAAALELAEHRVDALRLEHPALAGHVRAAHRAD